MSFLNPRPLLNRRLKWLLALLAGVGLAAILFRKPVQEAVLLRSLLSSDSASETAFLALADGAKDRFAFLQRIWNSKKIPHRALVATYLKDNVDTFKGKVVLLNFWTTWCPGCLMEIPDLIELQRKNADRLIILGISLDGRPNWTSTAILRARTLKVSLATAKAKGMARSISPRFAQRWCRL